MNPWIITISYGPTWFLTDVEGSKKLFNLTMDKVLPDFEKQIHPEAFRKKYLFGYSMGGFNAAQVLLKRPTSFDKYVFMSPAITTIGPYSPVEDIKAYIQRTGALSPLVHYSLKLGQREFPTPQDWESHDPIDMVQKVTQLPPVYISAGSWDFYGFDEGSFDFYNKLQNKAQYSMWIPIKHGYHRNSDPESVAQFLLMP